MPGLPESSILVCMAETSEIDEAEVALPAIPQPLLTPLTEAAIFLVFTIDEGGEQAVHDVLADISGLQRSIGFRVPAGGLAAVVASVRMRGTDFSTVHGRRNCIRSSS